jgi:hypothetical protein
MARAMQESDAWPTVFRAGSARVLSRAALGALTYSDDMEDAFVLAASKHKMEPVSLIEAWETIAAALASDTIWHVPANPTHQGRVK